MVNDLDEIEAQLRSRVEAQGWSLRRRKIASTSSRYYFIDPPFLDLDLYTCECRSGRPNPRHLSVRIAGHVFGSGGYDFNLAPGGDLVAAIALALRTMPCHWCGVSIREKPEDDSAR